MDLDTLDVEQLTQLALKIEHAKVSAEEKQRLSRATRNALGRTEQKSFFTTKSMCRQLVLAKADYEMTYDAIINEALEDWLAARKKAVV